MKQRIGHIYIVDKLVMGFNHVMFNTAFSSILSEIYSDASLVFVGESTHLAEVAKNNAAISNLSYQPYQEQPLPHSSLNKILPWIKKKIGDLKFIKRFYQTLPADTQGVFFTCLSTSSLYYAGYRANKSKVPAYFVLHGEVEFVFRKDIRLVDRIKGRIYKRMLQNMGDHVKCIALSGIVKENLVRNNILTPDKIVTVEHPVIDRSFTPHTIGKEKIVFGHIGSAMKKKHSDVFFSMAALLKDDVEKGKAAFLVSGKIDGNLQSELNGYVTTLTTENKSVKQEAYDAALQQMDYAVFLFDNNDYVMRVSGALMDALLFRKPLIALKQDFISYLFKQGGNIGFECETKEALTVLVKRIIDGDPQLLSQYKLQEQNLQTLMQQFSLEGVKHQLTEQL